MTIFAKSTQKTLPTQNFMLFCYFVKGGKKNGRKNATEVIDEKQDSARYAERMNQTPRKGARHKDAKQAAVTNRGRETQTTLSTSQFLVHFEEAGNALGFGHTYLETIRSHDCLVIFLVGFAEFNRHCHLIV